jgi:hypothetical protein
MGNGYAVLVAPMTPDAQAVEREMGAAKVAAQWLIDHDDCSHGQAHACNCEHCFIRAIALALARVRAEEREACAKIADATPRESTWCCDGTALEIARRIRYGVDD